jgi:hypothetical protein
VAPSQLELVALVDHPREDVATEIKGWLDLAQKSERANVARELIALVNHGGCSLLFGFTDEPTGWHPCGPCPYDLSNYSPDELNNILKKHAEPAFECYTYHITSTAGSAHEVVRVPGGHMMPIRAHGGPAGSNLVDHCYYIRRPGPESAPPDSGREWDELITRCVENNRERQVESFRRIIAAMATAPDVAASVAQLATTPSLVDWSARSLNRLRKLAEET